MSYEHDTMLKSIVETSWREMDVYASRVVSCLDGVNGISAAQMAEAIVQAAEEIAESIAHEKKAKAAASKASSS